jgi:membrane protein involved in colicin uptake
MIRRILQFSVISGLLASPLCFAATPQSSPVNIRGTDSSLATSGRLMLADNNDQDRTKAAKDKQKEKEELKKKQMEERKAKEEQRKKDVAERKAKDDQKKKEMAEQRERGKHKGKDERADNDKHKGRDEHRDRDRHKERAERGDKSKPAANAASPAAPAAALAPAAKPAASAPAPAPKPAAAPQAPLVVKTYPASAVVGRGATLNAYSSFPGKSVRLWFEWGNSPSFGQATASQTFTGEKSISQAMNVPAGRGKKYYYRAVAESSGSLVYGETMTFVTP